jgi:lysophospholipase L1-like esterase
MRFLALGDSYTIGEGVPAEGRWPAQLAARLGGTGVPVEAPQIVATTGWTTDELGAAMDAADFAPPYDLVSLLIGVNNQYRGRELDNYRDEFRGLLARAIRLAGGDPGKVVVVSIPDWGTTPFGQSDRRGPAAIGAAIDAFNAVNRDEALRAGVAWVDVTAASRAPGTDQLAEDGLHPSARQYTRWVDRIEPAARRILAGATPA